MDVLRTARINNKNTVDEMQTDRHTAWQVRLVKLSDASVGLKEWQFGSFVSHVSFLTRA
jgi:hypothetical protein